VRINAFLCPSAPLNMPGTGFYNKQAPGNSYFASMGASMLYDGNATGSSPNGLFNWNGPVYGVRDTTDGTSNTIAFGEWRIGDFNENKLSVQDVINIQGTFPEGASWGSPLLSMPTGGQPFQSWIQVCASQARSTLGTWGNNRSWIGEEWITGMPGRTMGTTLLPPNSQYPNCNINTWGQGDWDTPGMWNLSSYHPGGANVAFADGSVRNLKDSTALLVIWSLGTRAGGEVLSADSY
jgi:prepilin-type processing-associated H-X9-DG protein